MSFPSRPRIMGLAVGSIWLVAISAVFGIWSLVQVGTPTASRALVAVVAGVAAIIWVGISVARAAARMPAEPSPPDQQRVGRRFAWIVGAEILAFAVVNSWAVANERFILIPALDLIIVGLHFFPLASLFRVPRYHVMALLFCAIPAAILMLVPEASFVGHAQSWYVLPSLGCGAVAALTAIAGLKEAWDSTSTVATVFAR